MSAVTFTLPIDSIALRIPIKFDFDHSTNVLYWLTLASLKFWLN